MKTTTNNTARSEEPNTAKPERSEILSQLLDEAERFETPTKKGSLAPSGSLDIIPNAAPVFLM